ncbi:YIF1-domain-containing protein [Fusarium solani]|uniref:YIF1-domain-containing protein n=1 Tax=Fusarium solani TaxID=169388 RepID=A0A9P9KZQ0_FUSSL|nr:YIF1-domain-containing protein [Fusarium solani]KAH7271376.1 YIF1-domain-containing protein [Fusarium solani]
MQRATYAQSPPLHHPVPQHVSTVPQLRSPPPPPGSAQSHGYGGSGATPYQQQGGTSGNVFGAYGNFMNDPTAQVAAQFGQTAFKHGQEYMEQNFGRYVNVSALKHYFNVSNSYVVNKLFLVVFPWRHKPWSRKQAVGQNGQEGWYLAPRDDINSPDMYIPVMAIVTYILLSTLIAGLGGKFQPELLGKTATIGLVVVIVEIVALKLGCYLLSISSQSQLLDLIAYSGYKFVGIIVTIVVAEILNGGKGTGGWIGWGVFLYTFLANSLFLMRSLKYVLLPETSGGNNGPMQTDSRAKRNQRTQFLFFYSYIVQFFFMNLIALRSPILATNTPAMSLSSPMLTAALQNATLGAFANVLAQLITTYRTEVRMRTPGAQTYALLSFSFEKIQLTNFLETTFPAHPKPKSSKEKNTKPKLSVRNTAIKFLLDQTVGAALNTLLFSTYVHSFRLALHPVPVITSIPKTVVFLTSPGALNFSRVDWPTVWAAAQDEFVPFVVAGWKLWPAVSLVNFAAIKTVEGRNLVGALAGVAWGVYVSLVSAQ